MRAFFEEVKYKVKTVLAFIAVATIVMVFCDGMDGDLHFSWEVAKFTGRALWGGCVLAYDAASRVDKPVMAVSGQKSVQPVTRNRQQPVARQQQPTPEPAQIEPAGSGNGNQYNILSGNYIAMSYGRPGSHGSLRWCGNASSCAQEAVSYANTVKSYMGRDTVPVVNLNFIMPVKKPLASGRKYLLLSEATKGFSPEEIRRASKVCPFMLDVGVSLNENPREVLRAFYRRYGGEDIHLNLDMEWLDQPVSAAFVNQLAADYFQYRDEMGYKKKGLFGLYIFELPGEKNGRQVEGAILDPENIRWDYLNGKVIPMFDGSGDRQEKLTQWALFKSEYKYAPYLICMEFLTTYPRGSYDRGFTLSDFFTWMRREPRVIGVARQ